MNLHLASMDPAVSEWLNLVLRWAHIVAGIAWIGHSFFFLWLDRTILSRNTAGEKKGVEDALWIAGGGEFYRVEKVLLSPERMPAALHWFRWEAFFTWLSGVFLLGIVYHFGGLLVVPGAGGAAAGKAAVLGLGALPAAWLVYDFLWRSPLSRSVPLASLVSFALAVLLAYGLSRAMTGRSAYLHLGAVLGTLMAGNVWFRIVPAQQRLVAAMRAGREPDRALGESARVRSIHNDAMTFPVIFIMISNHFPTATHGYHWLMLAAASLAGAGVRHWMNTRRAPGAVAAVLSIAVLVMAGWSLRSGETRKARGPADDPSLPLYSVEPSKAASIQGVVRFAGYPPPNPPIDMSAEPWCATRHGKAPLSDAVLVREGKVQNAFVHVKKGLEGFRFEPPDREVVVDQKDCLYQPRIVGVQTGQPLVFLNSDETKHNVHIFSDFNPGWNHSMDVSGLQIAERFRHPEIAIQVRCDIHPWMEARVAVFDHPFFRVTGEDGSFSLDGLAPGEYEIEAWHEVLGTRSVRVTLGERESREIVIALGAP